METHVLRSAEGDTGDAGDALEVQLLDGLASLLLVTGVDDGGRATSATLARLDLGVGAVVILLLLDDGLLGLLVGKLFDTGVGHDDCGGGGGGVWKWEVRIKPV